MVIGALDWLGGAIGGATSLINGIFNRRSSEKMNAENVALQRETNAMQYDMMREQNDFNKQMAIDMFNMENEYNTPLAQVERLRAAGLNPAMMLGNGNMANTGDAMTPTGANVPTLTAPRVDKVPPVTLGFLDALKDISEISLNNSKKDLSDSETWKNYKKTEKEIEQMTQDVKYKQALTEYQNLQTTIDGIFAPMERSVKLRETSENIKYLFSMSALNSLKGDTEQAMKEYYKLEGALKDTENKQLIAKFGLVLGQLRANIRLLNQQAKTEETKQEYNMTGSKVNRAMARIHSVAADLEERKRDWLTERGTNEYGFPTESNLEKIFSADFRQKLSNLAKTDKEGAKLEQEIDNLFKMSRQRSKELDWFEVERCWRMFMDLTKQGKEFLELVSPFE